jgi:protein MYSM1
VKEKAVKPKVAKPPAKPPKKKPDPKPKPPPPPPVDRPRRARKPPRGFFGATSDLQMVECERYEEGEQPWRVTCSFEALALMDFHAHLSSDTEIIGFLGGVWDSHNKTLKVQRALPARRLSSADAGVEVELDPACVPEIVDALESDKQRVVGWYHSHPTFATTPSLRDCENQANYQSLFAEETSHDDGDTRKRLTNASAVPFVGAIVGPYRATRGDPVAEMTWFHVDADAGDGVLRDAGLAGQPKEVRVDREETNSNSVPEVNDEDGVFRRLRRDAFLLADVFGSGAERFDRVDLYKPWGSIVTDEADQTGTRGEPATRLTKMLRSLRFRVRDAATAEATDAFVDAVAEKTKSAWRGE